MNPLRNQQLKTFPKSNSLKYEASKLFSFPSVPQGGRRGQTAAPTECTEPCSSSEPALDTVGSLAISTLKQKFGITVCGHTHLHSIGDGQPSIGRRDLAMHQDNHKASGCDQSNADDVQAHGQPAHCAAEQVKRGLVVIQQLLVPETNMAKVSRLHEPDVLQISDLLKLLF